MLQSFRQCVSSLLFKQRFKQLRNRATASMRRNVCKRFYDGQNWRRNGGGGNNCLGHGSSRFFATRSRGNHNRCSQREVLFNSTKPEGPSRKMPTCERSARRSVLRSAMDKNFEVQTNAAQLVAFPSVAVHTHRRLARKTTPKQW